MAWLLDQLKLEFVDTRVLKSAEFMMSLVVHRSTLDCKVSAIGFDVAIRSVDKVSPNGILGDTPHSRCKLLFHNAKNKLSSTCST